MEARTCGRTCSTTGRTSRATGRTHAEARSPIGSLSTYGPTGIEHLFTVAATSDRFTDHERERPPGQFGTNDVPREYCGDRSERARGPSVSWTLRTRARLHRLEDGAQVEELKDWYWFLRWPCIDVTILPDLLEQRGISWKYYLGNNEYVHTIDWIRHARQGRCAGES